MEELDVIVVGSGLSGLSCAVNLVDKGKKVLVLEAREVIGGRTSSWIKDGMAVESGLHRFLGFYEELPHLLEHIGVDLDEILVWEDEIEIRLPDGGPVAVFGASPLHKPLESLSSLLLNNEFISSVEKIKLSNFFMKGFSDLKNDSDTLNMFTVYQYAKKYELSEKTIERILIPLTEGLFFLSLKKYSAYFFFALFSPYLTKLQKMRVGSFKGGMTEVMMEPIASYIKRKGGEVRVNSSVEDLITAGSNVRGVIVNGEKIYASQTILSTSLSQAQRIIKKNFPTLDFFKPMLSLTTMPSVTFQIELTEPSMDVDRTTFSPMTVLSSYSEQSRTTFPMSQGRFSAILAKPEKYLTENDENILKNILQDAKRLDLNLSAERVKSYRKIKWPEDFYAYEKHNKDKIPAQKTPIPGLTLAGDYTKQKYLQTMEGAVFSGRLAAEAVA